MAYVIVILIIICIYLFVQVYCLRRTKAELVASNEFLQSLRDNNNSYSEVVSLNRERIAKTEVTFDIITIDETLVVKDELDFPNKIITIYITKQAIDVHYIEKLKEIARIELYSESESIIKIDKITVDKEYRRNKIGSLLIKRVLEWAKIRNVTEVYLLAKGSIFDIAHEDLIKFYLMNGFVRDTGNYMKALIN